MVGTDMKAAFAGLNSNTNRVIESLLHTIWRACEFTDEHYDMLDAWRAFRGDAAKAEWRWWVAEVDADLYEEDFATEEEAMAAARQRYAALGSFKIIEARLWADDVQEGDDEMRFAEQRNGRTLEVAAND